VSLGSAKLRAVCAEEQALTASESVGRAALEKLLAVVQDLSSARDLDAVARIVRTAARSLTGADGATFVLRDGDQCFYADEDAISPLWKGQRFPMTACISGWAMLNASPVAIEDIYADDRIPADAYRPTFVKSLVMVPIRRAAPIGAIGNYWARRRTPTQAEIDLIQALADTTSVALENVQLYSSLQEKIRMLSAREARILEQRDTLDVFTRSLAHDLKEPVRTVRSFAELLLAAPHGEAMRQDFLRFIRDGGRRMETLIDAAFQYTRLNPDGIQKETVSLADAVEAAESSLAALIGERGATVERGPMPAVWAHRALLVQVLQNLFANAIGHSPRPARVTVSGQAAADGVRILVRDDGPGIAPEHLQKIFEPFRRLTHDDAHAGLGLSICRKIVEFHGGAMVCRSTPGEGAEFSFTLPDAPAMTGAPSVRSAGRPANVLIVDDREPDVQLALAFLGDPAGMRCRFSTARDGQAGLDAIADGKARGEPIDLVLLDINMPVMNGFEMLERMGADGNLSDVAVVMCSGSNCDLDKRRASDLGAIGYLQKPPRFEQLRAILESSETFYFAEKDAAPVLMRAA
jgi:two-component system CheB/CheR fusion protein